MIAPKNPMTIERFYKENAPDRLFLQREDGCVEKEWTGASCGNDDVEYIRADIHDAQIDALKAENASLHAECDRLTAMMGTGSLSEKKMNHAFLGGICVALQAITAIDNGVLWHDIVSACGLEKISHYANEIEPDEWELAGFRKYYKRFYKDEVANKIPEAQ